MKHGVTLNKSLSPLLFIAMGWSKTQMLNHHNHSHFYNNYYYSLYSEAKSQNLCFFFKVLALLGETLTIFNCTCFECLQPKSVVKSLPFARPQDMNPSNVIVNKLTRIQDYLLKKYDPELHMYLEKMEIPPQIYGMYVIHSAILTVLSVVGNLYSCLRMKFS